jgi:hypothetical protein
VRPRATVNDWDRMYTRECYEALPPACTATRPFVDGPYRAFDGRCLTWYWVGDDGRVQTITRPAIFCARPPYQPRLEWD